MSHREKVLAHLEALNLPLPEKRILERQWLETNLSSNAEYSFDFNSIIPSAGKVTWIIGTELNSVPESLMRMSIYALFKLKPKDLHYIDHSNNSKGRSVYRFEKIVDKYASPDNPFHKAAVSGKIFLDANIKGWQGFAEQWKKMSKVSFFKKPNSAFTNKDLLMLSMNPRHGVISELDLKVNGSNRAIIADMDCDSIFALGSRKHFGLNNLPRSSQALRSLLQKTDHVVEQRSIFLQSRGRPVVLIRRHAFDLEATAGIADISVSIRDVMAAITEKQEPWGKVAAVIAEKLNLGSEEQSELFLKAERMDLATLKEKGECLEDININHEKVNSPIFAFN